MEIIKQKEIIIEEIVNDNGKIEITFPSTEIDSQKVSDGLHTFGELYYHRLILFSIICNQNKNNSWKSKFHNDGTMYEGYFIVGIDTKNGQYTYHYKLEYWNLFEVKILEKAPDYDGHKPEDITRLLSLF
jgi:hypothetical protein